MGGALGGLFLFALFCFAIFCFGLVGLADKIRGNNQEQRRKEESKDQLEAIMEALELAGMFEKDIEPGDAKIIDNDFLSDVISKFITRDERLFWVGTRHGMQVISGKEGQKYGWYLTTGYRSIGFNWRRR